MSSPPGAPRDLRHLRDRMAMAQRGGVLDLSCVDVGDDGSRLLAEALRGGRVAAVGLCLALSGVGDDGAVALAAILEGGAASSSLTTLDLSCNRIGAVGAAALAHALTANDTVAELSLADNHVGEAGLAAVVRMLEHGGTSGGVIGNDASTASALTTLDLSGLEMGDAVAASLARALAARRTPLRVLAVGSNCIGPEGAASIARLLVGPTCGTAALTALDLGYNDLVGAQGTRAVASSLTTSGAMLLRRLSLAGVDMGVDGVEAVAAALAVNTALTALSLRDNDLGDGGATALADAVAGHRSLLAINLCENPIGARGHGPWALAMRRNLTLVRLDFGGAAVAETVAWANAAVARVINERTLPLGDGQQLDSGGDLAELPNELLCEVAARLWPSRRVLELGWSCQLLRDVALCHYVAFLRWGPGYGDWRHTYRAAWLRDDPCDPEVAEEEDAIDRRNETTTACSVV